MKNKTLLLLTLFTACIICFATTGCATTGNKITLAPPIFSHSAAVNPTILSGEQRILEKAKPCRSSALGSDETSSVVSEFEFSVLPVVAQPVVAKQIIQAIKSVSKNIFLFFIIVFAF